ncbi:MAG TPA: GAF domain-containing protein [Mycobacteriales bacterium]|nr:GAF domain-containing protein [Mycobacteriales bacterium]
MATSEELLAELGQLAGVVGPVFAPSGSRELLLSLTETARRLFGAAACSIALLDEETDELVYTTAAGAGAEDVTGMRLPASQGVAGFVVQSGQAVAATDLGRDPRFARDVAESTGYLPQAILAVPVSSPRRMIGVLSLLDRDASRPGAERDMEMASVFAEQAALAIEGSAAFADLGRALLAQLAAAAAEGSTLAATASAAAEAAGPADADLAAVAALLAELGRSGPRERRLAVRVLQEFLTYSGGRSPRPAR